MNAYERAQEFCAQFSAEEIDNARRRVWGNAYQMTKDALLKQQAEMRRAEEEA